MAVSEAAGTTTDGVQTETRYWYPPCSLVFVGSDGRHYRLDDDPDQWGDLPSKEQALAQGLLAHAQMRLMPQRWVAGIATGESQAAT